MRPAAGRFAGNDTAVARPTPMPLSRAIVVRRPLSSELPQGCETPGTRPQPTDHRGRQTRDRCRHTSRIRPPAISPWPQVRHRTTITWYPMACFIPSGCSGDHSGVHAVLIVYECWMESLRSIPAYDLSCARAPARPAPIDPGEVLMAMRCTQLTRSQSTPARLEPGASRNCAANALSLLASVSCSNDPFRSRPPARCGTLSARSFRQREIAHLPVTVSPLLTPQ